MFVHQCAEYQSRRGEEKRKETERRAALLQREPEDITPPNKGNFVWSQSSDIDKFESEWSMKPVSVKGIFDHTRELMVEKVRNGEKGVDVITPFYTHLDAAGKEQAILVNRGFVPLDLKDQRLHYTNDTMGTIRGILYRGDTLNKYSKPNSPTIGSYQTVRPEEAALISQLPNRDEASQVMLHMVDFEEDRRQLLPNIPTSSQLQSFIVGAERHEAYERMWRAIAFGGVIANTALWLCF